LRRLPQSAAAEILAGHLQRDRSGPLTTCERQLAE
jgi:hypothetical protein